MRVPWTARRSNLSFQKEIDPEYSLGRTEAEAQAPTIWPLEMKRRLTRKTLLLGKTESRRSRGQQWMRWLDGITSSMDIESEQTPGDGEGQDAWRAVVHGVTKSQTQLTD